MKWFLSSLCFLSINFSVAAQPNLLPADSLMMAGETKAAIELYRISFLKDSSDYHTVYNLSCVLAQQRQVDSAFKYLYISARLNSTEYPLTDPDLVPLRADKRWLDFENKLIASIQEKYDNPIADPDYARKLWRMGAYDQAYYKDIDMAEKKLGRESPVLMDLWDFKTKLNEENQKELEQLISKKGWPKQSLVGASAADKAFLIVQHSDLNLQKKYLPVIKKYCEQREASWQSYALMYDRIQTAENKPQRYGSQVHFVKATNAYELFPLEDESKVDEWRKEAGLNPLAEYVSHWNIIFPEKK